MNNQVACIIIAYEKRLRLLGRLGKVMASVVTQDFDEIVLVGDWPSADSASEWPRTRYLEVGALTHTTLDALYKRDAGTLATTADTLVYLSDDHALAPSFLTSLRDVLHENWDVLVPNRYTMAPENAEFPQASRQTRINLHNGEREQYCGGHAGVFRRHVVTQRPWAAQLHDRLWDFYASQQQQLDGAKFLWRPRAEIAVIDLIPEDSPWR